MPGSMNANEILGDISHVVLHGLGADARPPGAL